MTREVTYKKITLKVLCDALNACDINASDFLFKNTSVPLYMQNENMGLFLGAVLQDDSLYCSSFSPEDIKKESYIKVKELFFAEVIKQIKRAAKVIEREQKALNKASWEREDFTKKQESIQIILASYPPSEYLCIYEQMELAMAIEYLGLQGILSEKEQDNGKRA